MAGGCCEACGSRLPDQRMGRPRSFCSAECRKLNDAIARLERALEPVVARLIDGTNRERLNLVELRHRLFTLVSDEVKRPRNTRGQFMRRRIS